MRPAGPEGTAAVPDRPERPALAGPREGRPSQSRTAALPRPAARTERFSESAIRRMTRVALEHDAINLSDETLHAAGERLLRLA